MTDLPALPKTAQTYIHQVTEMAKNEVDCACASMENVVAETGPTRNQRLEDARVCVRKATSLLFDSYTREYLQAHRFHFLHLLPAICQEVERTISHPDLGTSFPDLVTILRETTSEARVKWANRASMEAAILNPSQWHDFGGKFLALMNEEHTLLRGARDPCPFLAYGDYTAGNGDSGYWWLTDGPREGFRARFEAMATQAGSALDPPPETTHLTFWLHGLFLFLDTDSRHLAGGGGHWNIRGVCEASATVCSRLEKCALVNEKGTKTVRKAEVPRLRFGNTAMVSSETRKRRYELIKQYRDANEFTMADLARSAGVSVTAIQGMVRGDRRVMRSCRSS